MKTEERIEELNWQKPLDDINSDEFAVPEFINNEDLADVKDYVVYDKNITIEQSEQVNNAIKTKISLAGLDMVIVFDGDSLTDGFDNSGINQYYPTEVDTWLNTKVNSTLFYSYGVGGQSTLDMITDAATQIDTKVDNTKQNVIVAWESVNAILNDKRTGQQNYDDMVTYFQGRKDAGFNQLIIVIGYYPRTPYGGSGWDTGTPTPLEEEEIYFDLVLNATNTPWNVVVDLRDNVNIGGAIGQAINPTYFNDTVHLETLGYDEVVSEVINNGLLKIFK